MTVEERCKNGYSLNRRQLFRWMYSHGYSKARMAHCLKLRKKSLFGDWIFGNRLKNGR